MNYQITNLTYSPIRLILENGEDASIPSRAENGKNILGVSVITDQIQDLANKGWLTIQNLSAN